MMHEWPAALSIPRRTTHVPAASRASTPAGDLELRISCWALEDLNLRPLPCQGRLPQHSDQVFRSSGHVWATSGVPSGPAWFVRLLDLALTKLPALREARLFPRARLRSRAQ